MLVLSRKKNESIVIDGGIVIEVLQISREQIRIGVTAPAEIKVLRGELRPFSQQPSAQPSAEQTERARQFVRNGNRLQSVREQCVREQCVREPELIFQTKSPGDLLRPRLERPELERPELERPEFERPDLVAVTPRLVRCG